MKDKDQKYEKIATIAPKNHSIHDVTRISVLAIIDIVLKFAYTLYKTNFAPQILADTETCQLVSKATSLLFLFSKFLSITLMLGGLRASLRRSVNELKLFRNSFIFYVTFEFGLLFWFVLKIVIFDCKKIQANRLEIVSLGYFIGGLTALMVYYFLWSFFIERAIQYLDVDSWDTNDSQGFEDSPRSYNTFDMVQEEQRKSQRRKEREEYLKKFELAESKVIKSHKKP